MRDEEFNEQALIALNRINHQLRRVIELLAAIIVLDNPVLAPPSAATLSLIFATPEPN